VAPGLDATTASPVRVFQRTSGSPSYADATSTFFGTSIPGQIHPRVLIVAVAHLHRRPGYWRHRLEGR